TAPPARRVRRPRRGGARRARRRCCAPALRSSPERCRGAPPRAPPPPPPPAAQPRARRQPAARAARDRCAATPRRESWGDGGRRCAWLSSTCRRFCIAHRRARLPPGLAARSRFVILRCYCKAHPFRSAQRAALVVDENAVGLEALEEGAGGWGLQPPIRFH